ncbi:septin 2 [Mortierella sp. AM989]|nr:septin 2 [Mortierella sp. AM989]
MADTSASLRFLLLGDVGVGKSAFVNTFASTLTHVEANNPIEEFIPTPITSATTAPPSIRLPGIHIKAGQVLRDEPLSSEDPLDLLPPKVDIPSRNLTFVTLPGYSSTINPSTILSLTDDYLNHHLHSVTSIFSPAIPSSQLAWFLIAGSSAHSLPTCAFYFVLYELKPIDIIYMKMIHERVNLIPIITKADTVPKNELWILKKRMLRQLKLNGIKIHTFGSDMETIENMTKQRQWGAPPFAISTRRDSTGKLLDSELDQLVNLCLYESVRHLQEDGARKVISWKEAFGISGNPTKTNVEKVWSERNVSANAVNSAINTTVAANATSNASNNPYFANMNTHPAVHQGQYPAPSFQQQQQQPFTPVTPNSQFGSQVTTPTNIPFTPPPSAGNNSSVDPAIFGLPTPGYAPPPSFSNGATSVYTAPPSSLNKQGSIPVLPLSGYQSPTAATPNGLASPPPRSASVVNINANTNSATNASQTRPDISTNGSAGIVVDNSTRPSEIFDSNVPQANPAQSSNGQDTQDPRRSFMENYVAPISNGSADNSSHPSAIPRTSSNANGNEVVKVEIPNSITSYQPSASETALDLGTTLPIASQMQQQSSFLIQGSFHNSTTYLIPPTDLYQGTIMPTNEYGEGVPDIWEAVELGDVATVQMHLNNGISPDQRNNSRSTLLHRTAWQGVKPFAVMKLLISYGANVNLTNENGNTVLQNVLMKHDDPSLIKLLLDNGAEAMIPNKEGMNTLEVAALFNKLESARYLLENDLSSSEPQSIMSALQRARSPDKKAMKALLKSWQGKDGERKRFELMERLRGPSTTRANDAVSVKSFETTKGDGKSSKWLKLKF